MLNVCGTFPLDLANVVKIFYYDKIIALLCQTVVHYVVTRKN